MKTKEIVITDHALQRCRDRLEYHEDNKNNISFSFFVKSLFRKSRFIYTERQTNVYATVTNNYQIYFYSIDDMSQHLIKTVIVKKC